MTDPVEAANQFEAAAKGGALVVAIGAVLTGLAKLAEVMFGTKPERRAGMKEAAEEWKALVHDARELIAKATEELNDCQRRHHERDERDAQRDEHLQRCEEQSALLTEEVEWMKDAISGALGITPREGITKDGQRP